MVLQDLALVGYLVLGLVAWGSVAALVYRDASDEGRLGALGWALVVFFSGPLFGLVFYKMGDYVSFGTVEDPYGPESQ